MITIRNLFRVKATRADGGWQIEGYRHDRDGNLKVVTKRKVGFAKGLGGVKVECGWDGQVLFLNKRPEGELSVRYRVRDGCPIAVVEQCNC